ncbi:Cell wall assembly and cell proliferation coordinating protein [Rhodopirellula baltica SH28]|uniref:Cell wall assembly and cell proliferation coordinating protein n=2 Tax=Rhodopirellula baltica TaxID=265606 RepID=K5CXC5_RHOBT|nr:Cell wall assembly and cell proliferation coordinating protein [Rhodopirellula baltica SH28]
MNSADPTILDHIRKVMPSATFDPPATPEMVVAAERLLGVRLPLWLRDIYLACNGFVGPTDVRYLYPLDGEDGAAEFTLFLRSEWTLPWIERATIFSENGLGGSLTVHWGILDGQLIEWCYGDGPEYSVADGDIFALLAREQTLWDETEANAE